MKTRYTILSVAAAALVLTACSNEDELSLQQGDEVVRIASASVVNSAQTRVNSDGAGDIEELYHKDLPGGKRHEIHTVLFREGGCLSIDFNAKGTLNERTVDKIAGYQGQQATDEGNHRCNCKSRMAGTTLASHSLYINLLS